MPKVFATVERGLSEDVEEAHLPLTPACCTTPELKTAILRVPCRSCGVRPR